MKYLTSLGPTGAVRLYFCFTFDLDKIFYKYRIQIFCKSNRSNESRLKLKPLLQFKGLVQWS